MHVTTKRRRRQKRAARLYDTHAGGLVAMAQTLTNTHDRADRLVVDAVTGQLRRRGGWLRREHAQRDMAGTLHATWVATHGPRGPHENDDTSLRSRLNDLTDLQLGLIALCLFGGYTYIRAGHTLSLTPAEAAAHLRDALLAVGAP